ncbi:MAG: hypothetical protein ACJAR2_000806 [Ilumatobacter sp.]|jgi:hypothetical protein
MQIAGDGCYHDDASAPASRVWEEIPQCTFDNRRCSMLDPDGQVAVVPLLANPTQRGRDDLLNEFDDGRTFVYKPSSDLSDLGFLTGQ